MNSVDRVSRVIEGGRYVEASSGVAYGNLCLRFLVVVSIAGLFLLATPHAQGKTNHFHPAKSSPTVGCSHNGMPCSTSGTGLAHSATPKSGSQNQELSNLEKQRLNSAGGAAKTARSDSSSYHVKAASSQRTPPINFSHAAAPAKTTRTASSSSSRSHSRYR
jgi:hypothetical protein